MYSDEIPIGVSAQNVNWDSSHDLKQVLGNIDIDNKGDIQQQIDNISSSIMVPDSELSSSSTNAVQNKIVKQALDSKADKTTIPTKTSQLINDAGFLTAAPVTSVNGHIGKVNLNLSDLGGLDRINGLESRIVELENASGGDDDDQSITIDSELLDDSQNPVQNRAIKAAFNEVNNQLNQISQAVDGCNAAIITHENRIHDLESRPTGSSVTIDSEFLENSQNPVQSKVIKQALDNKADLQMLNTKATISINEQTNTMIIS